MERMKAVILVGGQGTRLRPLTCNTPKAMVPILNRPFMEHLLRYLAKHGIEDVILAMGYLPGPIQDRLGDGRQFGVKLTYLVEDSPLGTSGAVKNAEPYLDGTFVVFNGDVLTEIDLTTMLKRHRELRPKASIALTPVENPTAYGVVETDATGRVQRFVEKPSPDKVTSNMINAGIYILEPEVLTYLPSGKPSMFEYDLFPRLLELGQPILGFPSHDYWIDIGTPEKYLKAHHDLLLIRHDESVSIEGKSQVHQSARLEGPILVADNCVIEAGAYLKGPVVLGPGCRIGGGELIEDSVLWEGVLVSEVHLRRCIVGSGARLNGHQLLEGCILGDRVVIDEKSHLAPGAKVYPPQPA